MKIFKLIVAGLVFGACFSARADFYASAGVGNAFNNASVDNGFDFSEYKNSAAYSLAGGVEIPLALTDVRAEGEFFRTRPKLENGERSTLDSAFVNGYIDVPLIPIIDLYVGAGIGFTHFEHNNSAAIQGMAGLEYTLPFTPLTFGGEYRYFKINEDAGKNNNIAQYNANMLLFKMRYAF